MTSTSTPPSSDAGSQQGTRVQQEPQAQIGRPREFDHDAVLAAVVDLFWEQGYSATSVGDIVTKTGLSKSSLYGAFGSKETLYQAALAQYLEDHRLMVANLLLDGNRGLADIDAFFARMWDHVNGPEETRGCLAVNTCTELGTTDPTLVEFGAGHRAFLRAGFTAALERAAKLGEFDAKRTASTANSLVATVLGLAVMIRGGASPDEVRAHLDSVEYSLHNS